MQAEKIHYKNSEVKALLENGAAKIAPLWSLENFVAVNPYLGMSDMSFSESMNFLTNSSDAKATLPISFYLEALTKNKLSKDDISVALTMNEYGLEESADEFIASLIDSDEESEPAQIKTISDVASEINGKKWRRFMVDRISFWASAYFDEHQAAWKTTEKKASLFEAWKQEAEIDRAPETMGLKGFRKFIKSLPNGYIDAAAVAIESLEIPESISKHYINSLLMKMNGWAGFAARIDWDERLASRKSNVLEEFLTILLVWEMALKELLTYPLLGEVWALEKVATERLVQEDKISTSLARKLILQDAFDRANQRVIIQKINSVSPNAKEKKKLKAQAVFCIDVRSEVFRRNLEAADDSIETLGFAGFFAFPIKYTPLAHEEGTNQCPVLLNTSHTIKESLDDAAKEKKALAGRTLKEQMSKVWKSFKSGAVTCFSFVSPLGIYFLPKLITDSLGLSRPNPHPDKKGLSQQSIKGKTVSLNPIESSAGVSGIPKEDRIKMATSALKAMSLTENFAKSVLIIGHGASTVNNPHATGLDCGACGGHSGESNAKVAAEVLNDAEVRKALKKSGILVPDDTYFIAGLHDTTTDEVSLFPHHLPESHKQEVVELQYSLKVAGESARKERANRMKITQANAGKLVIQRSKDWSQVRPEWGLAGCSSFIVAPRERTKDLDFGGKAFMHNYSWKKDDGFGVLELIMTAPMVVTSWINLQYYASTVDNKKFGSGNKALHNVVGGLGVLEGFGGDLRVGLPLQSVHDGEQFQHEPQRLNVIIEAPVDEMSKIIEKHDSIRQLLDNRWIYLFAMNDEGKVAYNYMGDLEWELI